MRNSITIIFWCETYYIGRPSQKEFDTADNDFWWCSTNVAKGLWRKELPYAKYMLDVAGASYEEIWNSLLEAGCLARKVGEELALRLGFEYPLADDEQVTAYLLRVRRLPQDASTFLPDYGPEEGQLTCCTNGYGY
jgi:aminoglycoside 6-adenylyltransferase